jgi:hypothetical protein
MKNGLFPWLRQEDCEFEVSLNIVSSRLYLNYIARSCFKNKQRNKNGYLLVSNMPPHKIFIKYKEKNKVLVERPGR